jgi:hypothetical protein
MTDDALVALERAGFDLAALSPDQLAVLCDLTAAEIALLRDIKERLDEAAPEVQAHAEIAGGALF